MTHAPYLAHRILATAVPLVLAACNDSSAPIPHGPAAELQNLTGDTFAWADSVGGVYVDTMVVRVVDANEVVVPNTSVHWTVNTGTLSGDSSFTNKNGEASVIWRFTIPSMATMGSAAGVLTVAVNNLQPIADTIVAASGAPVLAKLTGDNQLHGIGTLLPAPLIVHITDQHGNLIANSANTGKDHWLSKPLVVTWVGNHGTLSSTATPETMSDTLTTYVASDGTSQAYMQLGTTAGIDTVTVTLSDSFGRFPNSSVLFTEAATP